MVIVRSVTNSTKPYNIGSTDMLTVPLVKLVASIAGSNTEAIHGGIQHDERNDNTVLGQAPEFTRNWISWRKLQCWSYHNRGRSLVIKIISHSTLPSITIPFSRCYLHLYIICRSLRSTFYNVALDGCLLESRYGYFFSFLKCLPSVKKSICVHHGHYYSLKPGLPMCGGGGGSGVVLIVQIVKKMKYWTKNHKNHIGGTFLKSIPHIVTPSINQTICPTVLQWISL